MSKSISITVKRVQRGVYAWTDGVENQSEEPLDSILACVEETLSLETARWVWVSYQGNTVLKTSRDEMEHCREDVEDRLQAALEAIEESR